MPIVLRHRRAQYQNALCIAHRPVVKSPALPQIAHYHAFTLLVTLYLNYLVRLGAWLPPG